MEAENDVIETNTKNISSNASSDGYISDNDDMALDAINNLNNPEKYKAVMKLSALGENRKFRILEARRMKSRYGLRLIVELSDCQVFLPQRFSSISDKHLKLLNNQNIFLVYKGPIGQTSKIEFVK